MQNIGIFFGSATGSTETAANLIKKEFSADSVKCFDVSDAKASDIEACTNLIFGSSTWIIGELQDDFEGFVSEIKSANLEGKKVAIFGLGDQYSYPDSFADAIGLIYDILQDKGCEIIGETSIEGYEHGESRAERDGQFVGLVLDQDNQSELSDTRIKSWVDQLKKHFD